MGRITGLKDAHIYIRYTDSSGKHQKDSCITSNGDYSFKGDINEPTRIYFAVFPGAFRWVDDGEPNITNVYVEQGKNIANGDYQQLKQIHVTGSATNDEALTLNKKFSELNERTAELKERYLKLLNLYNDEKKKTNASTDRVDSLNKQTEEAKRVLDGFSNAYQDITFKFIAENPGSYISVERLNMYKTRMKIHELKLLFAKLAPAIQQSRNGKEITDFIHGIEQNNAGKIGREFTGKDPGGKTIKLSDYRGKYVLLDFWGSWCVPCRQAVPHLKSLFNKYNASGFEVIAIAVDDKMDAWTKAIKTDGTEIWGNILDEPGMDKGKVNLNAIHNQYNVHVFPTKLLIDRSGVILARYDGSDAAVELDKKLAELFGK
ncbi:Thiol-disulfide oxidoreductase ResA [compost metagenome]